MFSVKIKVKNKNPEAYDKLKKRLLHMSEKKVVAGFPKGKLNNPHYEGSKNHAGPSIIDVAIWNEFGTNNIPRRDFMSIATKKWQEYFSLMVEQYKDEIISGKIDIDTFLNLMGEAGAEFISEAIVKLSDPPNAPATIKRKGSSNPLVDTGDMSKAPTYELRNKEK